MAYFDAAYDRRAREHADLIEAVRAGMGFLHDDKAYRRWRADMDRRDAGAKDLAAFIKASGGATPGKSVLSN